MIISLSAIVLDPYGCRLVVETNTEQRLGKASLFSLALRSSLAEHPLQMIVEHPVHRDIGRLWNLLLEVDLFLLLESRIAVPAWRTSPRSHGCIPSRRVWVLLRALK